MKLFGKKEFLDDGVQTNKYYFCGIRYLKKVWSDTCKKTYLFKFKISEHKINDCADSIPDVPYILYSANKSIDIVIPVYNGYEYLKSLFDSVKTNTDLPYRLLVVNDASTDKRVLPLLKHYKTVFKHQMELINNDENLGFVKTVNKALALSDNHVVLLNTDVIVPKNWASRLLYPIFNDKHVASVTPFSNCATIFSLPNIGDNTFDGDLEQVNEKLSCINPNIFTALKFPTGVGFCMAMNKEAIKQVGMLDEVFYRGYGEENDWCQRAIKSGFYNTVAVNLFVWHKHGASFGTEKLKLIEKNSKIITSRYPNYDADVQKSIHNDIAFRRVRFLAQMLVCSANAKETQLWFDHNRGGGTNVYFINKCDILKENACIVRLQKLYSQDIKITYYYKNYTNSMVLKPEYLDGVLSNLNINQIVLNNLADWGEVEPVFDYISKLKSEKRAFVSFRGHDYAAVCPAVVMLNAKNKYCDIHDLSECKNCKTYLNIKQNIGKYHASWERFFRDICDECIVFSKSSAQIFSHLYPCCNNKIQVIPHDMPNYPKIKIPNHNGINIGVIGAIVDVVKGTEILKQMDSLLSSYQNVNIKIIGYADRTLENISQTGKYNRDDLPKILCENNIDIVFIPSVWPETFSYTVHEAMAMGVPVACFNLGAQAEYVKKYKKGLVVDKIDAKTALNEILNFVTKNTKPEKKETLIKNNGPFVSVIIPVYNRRRFCKNALKLLRAQTLQNIEFIIVDDGSTDGSYEYLVKNTEADKRFKVFKLDKNSGPSVARNLALKHVRGKYIGFFDIDDEIPADYFESLLNMAVQNKSDIVFTSHNNIPHKKIGNITLLSDKIGSLHNGALWDKLFDFDLIKRYNITFPNGRYCADNVFVFTAFYYAKHITLCNHPVYSYVLRQDSIGVDEKKQEKRKIDSIYIVGQLVNFINEHNFDDTSKFICINFLTKSLNPYTMDANFNRKFQELTDIIQPK